MKVLICSLAYFPFVGGAEIAVKEITDRISGISATSRQTRGGLDLSVNSRSPREKPRGEFYRKAKGEPASGWDFEMITVSLDGKQKAVEQLGKVKVYRLGRGKLAKYLFPFIALAKARKLHRQNNYDVVWAIMANQAGLAALRFKKKFPSVKYLLTLQEGDSLKRIWSRTWFMRFVYKQIYQKADFIQPISSYLARRAEKYGFTKQMEIVPNGVDLSNFTREFAPEELLAFKKKLNLEPQDRVVTTISRLVHKNGIDILIKAVKDLDVKVLIIGSGHLETKLKSLAQEIGVRDKILFTGYISQEKLPQYLKISDVFVRTSRSEGLGSAFLEAMAAGVPVIGTGIGGIPDFLKEGKTGLFAELGNPSDLSNKIQLLLNDKDLSRCLANNGRNLVLEHYDWNEIAKRMEMIFQKL